MNTLFHGDCIVEMDRLQLNSVDVVVTSPPYNIGKKYGDAYKDDQSREKFRAWCKQWIDQVGIVLNTRGSFFLNVGSCPANPLLPFEIVGICSERFKLQNVFHWIKSITIERTPAAHVDRSAFPLSVGHFKPINSKRFVNDCHEYVFHFTTAGDVEIDRLAIGVPYADKSNVKRWKGTAGKDLRCRGNTWFIPYETIQESRAHPAEFPVKLAENCIRLHRGARTVLDPFMGGGNSGLAAKRVGVDYIGIEIERKYYEIAGRRISEK